MPLEIATFESILPVLKKYLPYFYGAIMLGEAIYLINKLKNYWHIETATNLATGAISIIAQSILKVFFMANIYPLVYEHRLINASFGWWQVGLGFLMYTFLQFFIHYLNHKIRFFWCLHEVHHSATEMNITTGLRTSIFDLVSLEMLFLLIPFFGVHYICYFVFYSINKFWGSFIHINENIVKEIPWLRYILVTPAGHHIHHASNIVYLDKNYGELVPWFDMLFKTYAQEKKEPIQYGTLKIKEKIGFWQSQIHEFKSLIEDVNSTSQWKNKLGYIFMPPGWQPGSFENTAKQLQKKLVKAS
jgi:sterol desaturase/sphingolipid hydroxylase (fatty acid hydroxylase superfamily)